MIIWGKKLVYRRLGFVADFCPLCREVRTFALRRVGLAGHLYYLSLTQGELVEHRRRCTGCQTEFVADPATYARPSDRDGPVAEILPLTFPNLATHHAARLALEKSLRDPFARLPAQTRQALLREPFRLLSYMAEERFAGSTIDGESIAFFLGTLFIGGLAAVGLVKLLPAYEIEIWMGAFFFAAAATWPLSVWSRNRFIRRRVLPPILTALRPLKPTHEEIEAALADMKALGLRIGVRLKAKSVMQGLAEHR